MKYILYDKQDEFIGKFHTVYELRKFLCDRKYEIDCDRDISCTFDYIKSIQWSFDIEE